MRWLGALAPKVLGPSGARTVYIVSDDRGRPGPGAMEAFARAQGVVAGVEIGSDTTGAAWRSLGIRSVGTVVVIDRKGVLAWRAVDPSRDALRAAAGP